MDTSNGKLTESRFAQVLRLITEKKAAMAAEQRPWSIDWIQRQDLPRAHFKTMSRVLSGRGSGMEK